MTGEAVEFARPLHVLDRLREIGDPPCIGPQRGDLGHDVDEPRALADQRIDQFGAGHVALQADRVLHIGDEARSIGDDAGRHEIVDQLERHIAGIDLVQARPGAVDIAVEPVVHRLLHAFAMRCRDVEAAAEKRGQLTTVAAFRLLHPDREPLEHPAEFQRDECVERHVCRDRRESQHGAAIVAEEFQSADLGRHLEKLLADEEERGDDAGYAHGKADGAARHTLDRFLDALIDVVGRGYAAGAVGAGALLQVKVRVIAVEQGFVEATVQPPAPLAMQCRREEVPDTGETRILDEHEKDQQGCAGQEGRQRRRILRIVEEGDRIDEITRGFGQPDTGLAG